VGTGAAHIAQRRAGVRDVAGLLHRGERQVPAGVGRAIERPCRRVGVDVGAGGVHGAQPGESAEPAQRHHQPIAEIRARAQAKGLQVNPRGRIKKEIIDRYDQAHSRSRVTTPAKPAVAPAADTAEGVNTRGNPTECRRHHHAHLW